MVEYNTVRDACDSCLQRGQHNLVIQLQEVALQLSNIN